MAQEKKKPMVLPRGLRERIRIFIKSRHFSSRMVSVVVLATALLYGSAVMWSLCSKFIAIALVFLLSGGRCCWDTDCSTNPLASEWIGQLYMFGTNVELDIGGGCESTHGVIANAVYVSSVLCGVLSAVINEVYLVHTIESYQKHLRKMFQGQYIVDTPPSPQTCILGSMQYTGLQVAYIVFGWIIGTGFLALICIIAVFTTVLPILHIYGYAFWNWMYGVFIYNETTLAPGLFLVAFANSVALWLLVRFILQHSPGSVAITHRFRLVFHILDFFELLVYTVNGVFSVIYRVIWSLFYQLIFISRLDISLTPRGHEEGDPGFSAYLGFLYVEVYYNHPVFLTAVALFSRHIQAQSSRQTETLIEEQLAQVDRESIAQRRQNITSQRARARWCLAYTLQRNAELRLHRAHFLRSRCAESGTETVTNPDSTSDNTAGTTEVTPLLSTVRAVPTRHGVVSNHDGPFDGQDLLGTL